MEILGSLNVFFCRLWVRDFDQWSTLIMISWTNWTDIRPACREFNQKSLDTHKGINTLDTSLPKNYLKVI